VLLEAGGADTNPWIHIPLGFGKNFANAAVNWCYETEPDASIVLQLSFALFAAWVGRCRPVSPCFR
jgi:choline dehydrogenase-like flavoprotein